MKFNPIPKPRSNLKSKRKDSYAEDKKVYNIINQTQQGCQICGYGNEKNIARHHIRFGSGKRLTYIGNVIKLCKSHYVGNNYVVGCHEKVHTNDKLWRSILVDKVNEIHGLEYDINYRPDKWRY